MPAEWELRPEIVVLREQCREVYRKAYNDEISRRKTANALENRGWEVKPADYRAADEAGFSAMWNALMAGKDLICAG